MNRAFSVLDIKAASDANGKRIIKGIATTPTPDRLGDIVEPKGAEFTLPIPLLWQHNSSQPIGNVTEATVTKDGINIVAEIANIEELGTLKNRLDEAWQSMKAGLVRGLSIGFKTLEFSRIEGPDFAIRHLKWLWVELSAVTIPANAEASITSIKSLSNQQLTALGLNTVKTVRLVQPSGLGNVQKNKTVKLIDPKEKAETT